MARRRKARRSRGKGSNSCCPMIRVKCGRRGRGGLGDAAPGFMRTAEQLFSDRRAAQTVERKKGRKVYCTVKVGSSSRRVHVTKLHSTVSKLVRGQHKKRCIPLLNGKLIVGQRAAKF